MGEGGRVQASLVNQLAHARSQNTVWFTRLGAGKQARKEK